MFIKSEHHLKYMNLFSLNASRWKLLEILLVAPEVRVRQLAREAKQNPSTVSVFLSELRKAGIVKNGTVNESNPLTKSLKILINTKKLVKIIPEIKKTKGFLGCGFYGSWVKGTNNADSDCDLWIKTSKEPSIEEKAALEPILSKKLGVHCSALYLTPQIIEKLQSSNYSFYCSLFNSLKLEGEEI